MPDPTTEELKAHLAALPPQKLIVRGVDELRPTRGEGHVVVVGPIRYVEIVTVAGGARQARRFDGIRADDARTLAEAHGHTVIVRSGNIT